MASNNLSPNYAHSIGAAVTPSSDPTVDLKTLVTALESLLNLAQSQLNLPTSSSTPESSARLDSLSINTTSSSPHASSTKSKASSNNSDLGQGELGDIVYVEVETLDETLDAESVFGTVEAVKTVSDLFMRLMLFFCDVVGALLN